MKMGSSIGKVDAFASAARAAGYSDADISGGRAFYRRKNRLENPPGSFDSANRFYADERTNAVCSARTPSRSWPFSQMKAARTADHCAEVFGALPLNVKRIARALETLGGDRTVDSHHAALAAAQEISLVLKPAAKAK